MANKNSINNLEINVEQLYDASGNMIYPLIRFDSRYSVSSPEQLSFPADGEISYNLKHGVPRFYADKLIEDVEITTDFKSRQIAAYQGNNNESYPLMVFSTSKGDLYSFVPRGTFATEEYVNDEISKVQIGSGGNVDIEALKKYIDGLIDDKLDNVDGNENVNALTIMAYKATDSSLTPDTPIGGSWTRGNDGKIEIDYPDGWGSPSSDEAVNGKYLWTSSSIQIEGGNFLSDWTTPLCIKNNNTFSNATSIFTSFAFTRNNKNLYNITVTGGDYNNPIPVKEIHIIGDLDVEVEWYDTIPTNSDEIVWMVKRTFSSNDEDIIDEGWSKPVQMTDTTDFEVIYSAVKVYNSIPDGFSKAEDGVSIDASWLENAHDAGWYDDPEDCLAEDVSGNSIKMPPIWMATSKCHNGDWSEWNIVQIKGEDGKDGTKINIKGTYDSYEDLYMAWKNDKTNYAAGDSYVVSFVNVDSSNNWIKPIYNEETQEWTNSTDINKDGMQGVLFVYDGSDEWIFSGQFKGDSAFIHIKYANDASLDDENSFNISIDGKIVTVIPTELNGEEPGKYIGIYTDNKLEDSSDYTKNYKWSLLKGEDGWGYEYIYYLYAEEPEDGVPTPHYNESDEFFNSDEYQKDDYIPSGWTDSQSGVSAENPFEYVCHRKYVDGKWSQFYGSSSNPGFAALCSKYGKDGQPGQDGKTIEYIYLLTSETPSVPKYDENFINSSTYQENDFIPDEWQDSPKGISEDNPTEWFCTRKRDKTTQQWGAFQGPGLWAKWGVNGQDGDGVQYIYVVTANNTEMPDNPTPDTYESNTEYQDKNGEWGNGKPVTINNGTSTGYTWSDDPQGVSINMKTEWVSVRKYRDSSWGPYSDPKPWAMFGKEGTNGANLRTMYGAFSDASTKEEIERLITKDNIDPGSVWGYTKDFVNGQKLWSIYAYTDYSNNLVEIYDLSRNETIYGWQGPFIAATYGKDGSTGKQGPTGDQGLTGLPGNSFEIRYCLGKINDPDTTEDDNEGKEYQDNILNVEDIYNYDSSGWYKTTDDIYSKISEDWPYVYCVQGEKTYTRDEDNKEVETIIWGSPFRLSGLNGMKGTDGSDGKNGQIVYPSGVYDPTKTYTLDDYKAPYVYDSKDGNYYVLNIESWLGTEHNGVSPSDIQGMWEDANNYWQLIENYEAVFAKVGIISNGMVGSAVFNGDYMFSQIGLENSGNMSDNYEYFMQNENEEKTETPYDSSCIWKPSYCVNLRTGQVWSGAGTIVFNSDGSGKLASGEISWDSSGNLKMPTIASLSCKYVLTDDNILIDYLNCNGSISNGRFGDTINLLFKFYLDNDFTNLIYEEEVIDFRMPNSFNYNFNINNAQSVELYSRTLVENELGEENNIDKLLAKYIIETANTRVNTLEITNNIGDSSVVIDLIYNDSSIRIENDETKTINISESNILSWYVKNLNTNDNKATQYSYWLTGNKSIYNHVLDRVFDLKARPYGYIFKNADHNLQVIYKNANPIEVNDKKVDQIYYRNFQYNITNNSSDDIDFWPLSFNDIATDTENGYVLNDNITPSFRLASGETFVYNNLIAYEDLNGAEFSLGLTNLVIKTLKNNNISINLNSESLSDITYYLENFEDKTIGFDITYDYSDSNDKLTEDKLIDINITLFDIISSDEDIDIYENGNLKS